MGKVWIGVGSTPLLRFMIYNVVEGLCTEVPFIYARDTEEIEQCPDSLGTIDNLTAGGSAAYKGSGK